MDYSALTGSRWKLAPGSLTSGGDHLCTERLASGGNHLDTERLASGGDDLCTMQPHQRRRPPLHRWLASDGGHLSACKEVLAPVPLWG